MFVILSKAHEDVHEPLTLDEVQAALKHLLAGRIDVTEEEYQALKNSLTQKHFSNK